MLSFLHKRREQAQLFFSTDIHCHLVPGVDDGSPDAATSADLIERMMGWGIRRIITTPHVTMDTFENTPDILDPAFDDLLTEVRRRGLDIQLDRTCEYRIDDFFKRQIDLGAVTPYPDGYILVENPFTYEPVDFDNFVYDLKTRGYRPILAHPERCIYYNMYNPHRWGQIYRSGTYLQVNLLSFTGYYGKEEKKIAETLLDKGYIDFIGTDLHNHRHADHIDEFLTTKAYRRLADRLRPLNDSRFPRHIQK